MIPRTIHQIWIGPHPEPEEWMDSWHRAHPGWVYRLWREADIDALGLANRRLYERMYGRKLYDAAADVARVEILLRYGGVYIDADSECLAPLEDAAFMRQGVHFWAPVEETTTVPYRLITNAFMGAEPDSPVLQAYRSELAKLRRLTPTWECSGPAMLTRILEARRFTGVEIVPMAAFYTHTLQGAPVDGEHYGTHHWASTNYLLEGTPFSILVAFREDSRGERTPLWDFVRSHLEKDHPSADIVVGSSDDVPFNKCKAINQAAREAKTDIFLLTDSDTWVDPNDVRRAVKHVAEGATWVRPWLWKTRLSKTQTEAVLAKGLAWDGEFNRRANDSRTPWWSSPPLVLSRDVFETVNGMDERFSGWGQEDDAFGHALEALVGTREELGRRDSVHLWHPRLGKLGDDAWEGSERGRNRERGMAYIHGTQQEILELVRDNRPGISWSPPPELPPEYAPSARRYGIPRTQSAAKLYAEQVRQRRGRRMYTQPARPKSGPASVPPLDESRVSILVPFRAEVSNMARSEAWLWNQQRWTALFPDAELVVGEDTGGSPFSKSCAVNDAYQHSTREVLVIADADAVPDYELIARGVATAEERARLVVPWGRITRLCERDTRFLLRQPPEADLPRRKWVADSSSPSPHTAATLIIITRADFEMVNGMDERFRGWGHEDVSFWRCCAKMQGMPIEIRRMHMLTLWHSRPYAEGGRVWEGEQRPNEINRYLAKRYQFARNRDEMQALVDEHPLGQDAVEFSPDLTARFCRCIDLKHCKHQKVAV